MHIHKKAVYIYEEAASDIKEIWELYDYCPYQDNAT